MPTARADNPKRCECATLGDCPECPHGPMAVNALDDLIASCEPLTSLPS